MFFILEWLVKILYGQEALEEARKLNSTRRKRR